MSVTVELLNKLESALGGVSDYRAAKELGVAQQTVSKYRNNQSPMSPEKVILACKLAGLNENEWLIKLYKERAKCTEEISILDNWWHQLAA